MFNTLRILLSLENTININVILHGIRSIPIIGKHIPERIYGVKAIKIITLMISLSYEMIRAFFGSIAMFLFLFFASGAASSVNGYSQKILYMNGFLVFSVAAILGFNLFHVSVKTKYAVFLMGMDAKEYVLTEFVYHAINRFIGYSLWGVPTAILSGVNWYLAILIPFAGVSLEAFTLGMQMTLYAGKNKRGRIKNRRGIPKTITADDNVTAILISVVLIAGAIFTLAAGYLSQDFPHLFIVYALILILSVAAFYPGILLIRKFPHGLYRTALFAEQKKKEIVKEKEDKLAGKNKEVAVNTSAGVKTGAGGYRFLNEIFIKRHKKVFLTRLIFTIAGTVVSIALVSVILYFELRAPHPEKSIIRFLFSRHPGIFVNILFYIHSGAYMSHAMFANCDSSMLSYRFYREPAALKSMYFLRVKSAFFFNLIPAVLTAVFAVVVLALTGGEYFVLQYLFTVAMILLCVIFFSLWHLTIYYLIQPYAEDLTVKSKLYGILSFLMATICFIFAILPLNALVLTLSGAVITALFALLSGVLVSKVSPVTFRKK